MLAYLQGLQLDPLDTFGDSELLPGAGPVRQGARGAAGQGLPGDQALAETLEPGAGVRAGGRGSGGGAGKKPIRSLVPFVWGNQCLQRGSGGRKGPF